MKSTVGIVALCLMSTMAVSQGPTKKPSKPNSPRVHSDAPVTRTEAHHAFVRLEKLLAQTLGKIKCETPSKLDDSSTPVTRFEVAREFARLRSGVKPYFKLAFRPVRYDEARLIVPNAEDRKIITSLIAGGFVSDYSAIPCGPKDSMTTTDFGDAIGFFATRVMEYCHLPSSKWTPALHKD